MSQTTRVYIADVIPLNDDTQDDADKISGTVRILKDGEKLHTPMYAMDSEVSSMRLCDAFGQPVGHKPGYAFDLGDENLARNRAADRAFEKAKLSAAYRGGLSTGDFIQFGDRRMEVTGYNDKGKVILSDASQVDTKSVLRDVYADAERELTSAWKAEFPHTEGKEGDKCTVREGGVGEGRPGHLKRVGSRLVCVPDKPEHDAKKVTQRNMHGSEPSDMEWSLSGPLSDSESRTIKDQAHQEYLDYIQNAWRK